MSAQCYSLPRRTSSERFCIQFLTISGPSASSLVADFICVRLHVWRQFLTRTQIVSFLPRTRSPLSTQTASPHQPWASPIDLHWVFSRSAEREEVPPCSPPWQGCDLLGGSHALLPLSAVALSSKTPVRHATWFQSHRRRQDPLSPCWATPRVTAPIPNLNQRTRTSQNTARPATDFHDAWARAFLLSGMKNLAIASKRSTLGEEKTTNNGNCRLACASVLHGVESFKFFNIRQWLGVRFPRFVEDAPRCCNPSGASSKCANAMRQRFGDSQTRASERAETNA